MPLAFMKSDAYDEAGHAVVGVVLKFTLVYVSGDAMKGDPHCKWTGMTSNTSIARVAKKTSSSATGEPVHMP